MSLIYLLNTLFLNVGCCFDDSHKNSIVCFKHPRQPTPFPTTPPTTPQTTIEPIPYQCDFEKDLCYWINHNDNHMDFIRQSGSTPSVRTGPKNDHTLGSKLGKVLQFRACIHLISLFLKQHDISRESIQVMKYELCNFSSIFLAIFPLERLFIVYLFRSLCIHRDIFY